MPDRPPMHAIESLESEREACRAETRKLVAALAENLVQQGITPAVAALVIGEALLEEGATLRAGHIGGVSNEAGHG